MLPYAVICGASWFDPIIGGLDGQGCGKFSRHFESPQETLLSRAVAVVCQNSASFISCAAGADTINYRPRFATSCNNASPKASATHFHDHLQTLLDGQAQGFGDGILDGLHVLWLGPYLQKGLASILSALAFLGFAFCGGQRRAMYCAVSHPSRHCSTFSATLKGH
jgi:hypothetical protein